MGVTALLAMQTWAVVGLSNNRSRAAFDVADFLQRKGKRNVPGHPSARSVHGGPGWACRARLAPCRPRGARAEDSGLRTGGVGARCTMRVVGSYEDGAPVAEQFATMLIRGIEPGDDGGPTPPAHSFPPEAKAAKLASVAVGRCRQREKSSDNALS